MNSYIDLEILRKQYIDKVATELWQTLKQTGGDNIELIASILEKRF